MTNWGLFFLLFQGYFDYAVDYCIRAGVRVSTVRTYVHTVSTWFIRKTSIWVCMSMLERMIFLGEPKYPQSSAPDTPQVEVVQPNEGQSTRSLSMPHTEARKKTMPPRDNQGLWTADYFGTDRLINLSIRCSTWRGNEWPNKVEQTRSTLGLSEIRTANPLPMHDKIHRQRASLSPLIHAQCQLQV